MKPKTIEDIAVEIAALNREDKIKFAKARIRSASAVPDDVLVTAAPMLAKFVYAGTDNEVSDEILVAAALMESPINKKVIEKLTPCSQLTVKEKPKTKLQQAKDLYVRLSPNTNKFHEALQSNLGFSLNLARTYSYLVRKEFKPS